MNTRFPTEEEREKRTTLLELLKGGLVMVHLDTRRDGVDVPEHLRGTIALALNLSHAFRLDLFELGPYAVTASLSFGDATYRCVLPWNSIFAMTRHADDERRVFVQDIPIELARELAKEAVSKTEDPETETVPDEIAPDVDQPPEKPAAPHLRLLDSP